jgi:hypothetical protein
MVSVGDVLADAEANDASSDSEPPGLVESETDSEDDEELLHPMEIIPGVTDPVNDTEGAPSLGAVIVAMFNFILRHKTTEYAADDMWNFLRLQYPATAKGI